MGTYENAMRRIGLAESLIDLALGRIELPLDGWNSPAGWYVFPPALIPLASDGSGPTYIGVWKHWFSRRSPSFVKMYVDSRRLVVEIGRSAPQLFCSVAMTAMSIYDGITPALTRFADDVHLPNLLELDAVSQISGDEPAGFSRLPQFQDNRPANMFQNADDYDGDFPLGVKQLKYLRGEVCSFELQIAQWPAEIQKPRWLLEGDKQALFEEFLDVRDFRSAWFTLNSTGWSVREAKIALARLADLAGNAEFRLLADAWRQVASSDDFTY